MQAGRIGLLVAAAAAVGLTLAGVGQQVLADTVHREFWPAWTEADAALDAATARLDGERRDGASLAERAAALDAALVDGLFRVEDRTALADAAAGLDAALTAEVGAGALGIVSLTDPEEFAPAWERYADLWEILELAPERTAAAAERESAADAITTARTEVEAATETLVEGAMDAAGAALANHPSATFEARRDLQQLLDHEPGMADAAVITELAAAVADVRASHAAEVARAEAYPVRAEIEAFARSIANGVALDFAWAYEVNGLTSDSWFSGTAEFGMDGEEWGLITLSESVEWAWGVDPNAEAVVVHEVGHTQVVREACAALFEQAGSDHELWATAWAISMGYDLPGAGIEAYGRPSDPQVAAAAQCR